MDDFYSQVSQSIEINDDSSVLVVCGGEYDQRILEAKGIQNAVISNVSHHAGVKTYGDYPWQFEDAEDLTCEDESFDWVLVHAGLHHCASPHRAMCEMLRVARQGILIVEARDSLFMRFAAMLKLTPNFELEPALLSGGTYGGYRDTPIPNYIYRWTERDVEKTVTSYAPARVHKFEYHYGWRLPVQRMSMSKSPLKRGIVGVMNSLKAVLQVVLRRQGNCFGIVVRKTDQLQPWVTETNGALAPDLDYIGKIYNAADYKRK